MSDTRWKPNVTVATVVEKEGKYLLVHETPEGVSVFNQPAGHLDEGESLIAAAKRETLEETAWEVSITHYLGVYRYLAPNGITYLRHGFSGKVIQHHNTLTLDKGIIEAVWMNYDEIQQKSSLMRSPMVIRLIDDYRAGRIYSLAVIHEDS